MKTFRILYLTKLNWTVTFRSMWYMGVRSRWWMKFPTMWRWSLDATGANSPTRSTRRSYTISLTRFGQTLGPLPRPIYDVGCSAQRVVHRVINSPRMPDVLHGPVAPESDARAHRPPRANKSSRETHPERWRSATHVCRVGRDTRMRHPVIFRIRESLGRTRWLNVRLNVRHSSRCNREVPCMDTRDRRN